MRVLDLFSGIGGFSLGLQRAGMRTVAFCEIDPYCRRVLAKHWPAVPVYPDVRQLTAGRLAADGIAAVDLVCGGFPCQDISVAGAGAGIAGERSGLWSEFARLIGELRPRYALVENVAALLVRGLERVLGDLAALGYDAEWHCISAAAVGAPHRRDRIWIVAYPNGHDVLRRRSASDTWDSSAGDPSRLWEPAGSGCCGDVADPALDGRRSRRSGDSAQEPGRGQSDRGGGGADAVADADQPRLEVLRDRLAGELATAERAGLWRVEPDLGRVAYGIPHRVDRLRALGNAVVPQIPELIGRAILAARP